MGLLAFPAMLKAGYDQRLSAGVICAGGTLGILIPPSIMLIVYAATSSISVVRLYAAALLPGLLLAGLYILYVIVRAMINPKLAPKLPPEQANVPWGRAALLLLQAFVPLAVLILSVLGSILSGWRRRPRRPQSARSAAWCLPPPTGRSPGRACRRRFISARGPRRWCVFSSSDRGRSRPCSPTWAARG